MSGALLTAATDGRQRVCRNVEEACAASTVTFRRSRGGLALVRAASARRLVDKARFCHCRGDTFGAILWPHQKIEIGACGQVRATDRSTNHFVLLEIAVLAGRWSVLALLFAVRATMGFQYQSVASVAPLIARDMGVTLADIGLLFGLYLAPGMALAYPGGSIGRRFGDRPIVLVGLALMVVGGAIMAFVPTWPGQIVGRLVAGVGGVLINVLMAKMVTDWFAGREIATAMAVFVNSWPAGIAAALLVLPPIAEMQGLKAAYLFSALLVLLGLVLLTQRYTAPPRLGLGDVEDNVMPERAALKATIVAGSIWGLYNAGMAMVFAFGPSLLVERGWPITSAGSTVSLVLWLAIFSVPLGGFLADRLRLHGIFVIAGCLAAGILMVLLSKEPHLVVLYPVLGLVAGLPAGPIMSLPSRVLGQGARAIGMGAFFSVFYAAMVLGPALGGWVAAAQGSAAAAIDFGALMLFACVPGIWLFRRLIGGERAALAA
jgi:MFS family permease